MQLYNIDESDVIATVKSAMGSSQGTSGKREAINGGVASKYGYPLKVVFILERGGITVISAYPLKKEHKS